MEVIDCWGPQRPIECFLTIGTGISPNVSLGEAKITNIIAFPNGLIETATGCEDTHKEAEKYISTFDNREDPNRYYRFNMASMKDWTEKIKGNIWHRAYDVVHVVKPGDYADIIIGMDRWQNMGSFVELTKEYMKEHEQQLQVEKCALKLTGTLLQQ